MISTLTRGSSTGNGMSTLLAVRVSDDIIFYNTSDWSIANTFAALSCGPISTSPARAILEISPDNSFFITNGSVGQGAYSMIDGSELFFIAVLAGNPLISVSKDGGLIACYFSYARIQIVETVTWTKIGEILDETFIGETQSTWSYDGSKLALISGGGTIIIYNTTDYTAWSSQLISYYASTCFKFSPDDSLLVTCSNFASTLNINVMNVEVALTNGSAFTSATAGTSTAGVVFTSDSKYLIASSSAYDAGAVEKFDTTTWASQATSLANNVYTNAIAISSDDTLLACVGNGSPYLEIRDVSDLTEITGTPVLSAGAYTVAWDHATSSQSSVSVLPDATPPIYLLTEPLVTVA